MLIMWQAPADKTAQDLQYNLLNVHYQAGDHQSVAGIARGQDRCRKY